MNRFAILALIVGVVGTVAVVAAFGFGAVASAIIGMGWLGFLARHLKADHVGDDILLSTAAHNSARFPFISPPGSIRSQTQDQNQMVADRIVEGKMTKWFEEHCLLDQAFVKDDTLSVGELIYRSIGALGEKIRVRRFTRYALGE